MDIKSITSHLLTSYLPTNRSLMVKMDIHIEEIHFYYIEGKFRTIKLVGLFNSVCQKAVILKKKYLLFLRILAMKFPYCATLMQCVERKFIGESNSFLEFYWCRWLCRMVDLD